MTTATTDARQGPARSRPVHRRRTRRRSIRAPGLGKPTSEESLHPDRHLGRGARDGLARHPAAAPARRAGPGSWSPWFVLGILFTTVTGAMTGRRVDVVDRVAGARHHLGSARRRCCAGQHDRLRRLPRLGAAAAPQLLRRRHVRRRSARPVRPRRHRPRDPRLAIELGIAIAVTLPLGIGTAVFMTEVGGRFAGVVRTIVEAMTALPSIVAGLFIYTVLIVALGLPALRLRGRDGARRDDAADHRPRRRRGAAGRARWPARGQPRARGQSLAHGLARRAARPRDPASPPR